MSLYRHYFIHTRCRYNAVSNRATHDTTGAGQPCSDHDSLRITVRKACWHAGVYEGEDHSTAWYSCQFCLSAVFELTNVVTRAFVHTADKGNKKRKSSSEDSSVGGDKAKQRKKKAMIQAAGAMKSELATFGYAHAEDFGKKIWDDFKKEDPEVITIRQSALMPMIVVMI